MKVSVDKMEDDERAIYWMNHAIRLAKKAKSLDEVPVGAVIVLDNEIIGEGWNQPISSCDTTAHAEIVAIRNANSSLQNYRLPQATLYVTIEPCAMCLGAVIHSRISKVVFGATEPKAGMLESHTGLLETQAFNHKFDFEGGVCEKECASLLSDFFKLRRKQKKEQKSSS